MDDFDFKDWISLDIWMKLISTATQASLDNDKVNYYIYINFYL